MAFIAFWLVACGDGTPSGPASSGSLFDRYVALGNSITAGYESEGVNDSTQHHAYPVLLAERAGASFPVALLNKPGCPPPLVGPVAITSERVGGAASGSCAGLGSPSGPIRSLAVPGFQIADAFQVPGGPLGFIYALVFGSRTLVEHMVDLQPTLVSVWLGNNDALSAALQADLGLLTPEADFRDRVEELARMIADETDAQEAVWISVLDPLLSPILQPGAYFWGLSQDPPTAPLLPKPVNPNCAPRLENGDPNPLGANLVSFMIGRDGGVAEISCAGNAPYVLDAAESALLSQRVAAFNAAIQDVVTEHGWIYVDGNALAQAQLQDPDRIRKCQGLLDVLSGAAESTDLLAALQATCPHPDAPNFFGSLLSFDGVHPSLAGQGLVADAIAEAITGRHGLDI